MSNEKQGAEPDYALSMRGRKDSPWYLPDIEKNLVPESRKLLENYSKIPPEQIVSHIHDIRDKCWSRRAYPCTGLGRWLVPTINLSPAYQTILKRLMDGEKFLDVGAYMGQDLRKLVFDGAPSDNLYAVDIVSHWDLGYEMFRDKDCFSAHFIEADITRDDPRLQALSGQISVISITHVLHQWLWEDQLLCCKKLAQLSKVGTIVTGMQIGNSFGHPLEKEEVNEVGNKQPKMTAYKQGPDTFPELWKQVGEQTGTKWSTEARLRSWEEVGWDPKDQGYFPEGTGVLEFVVTREG